MSGPFLLDLAGHSVCNIVPSNTTRPGVGTDPIMLKSALALKAYFERTLKVTLEFLSAPPESSIEWEDVQFSLMLSQQGLWGLRPSAPLPKEKSREISETFNSLLARSCDLSAKVEYLDRFERKLCQASEDLPSNVISFRRKRLPQSEVPRRKRTMRMDCLIESLHVSEAHKMAMELHSQSSRFAFVNYPDLNESERRRLSSLLSLGPIHLFIPNLLQLSQVEQDALLQLISQPHEDRPLIMACSPLPYADLRNVPLLNLQLVQSLSRAYIKLTRPFREYRDQGLIHYFLDTLSESPT